jgi:predicted nucleic acid-binding protein
MLCSDGVASGFELYITIVTLAELRFGIGQLSIGNARRGELDQWLTRTIRPMFDRRVLPVTEDIMLRWRILMEDGRKTGHTYSQPDLMIAATALEHGLTVVTRDAAISIKPECRFSTRGSSDFSG